MRHTRIHALDTNLLVFLFASKKNQYESCKDATRRVNDPCVYEKSGQNKEEDDKNQTSTVEGERVDVGLSTAGVR